MAQLRILTAAFAISTLSACGAPDATSDGTAHDPADNAIAREPSQSAASSEGDGANDGFPDLSPPPLTTEAAKGETGARNVLLSWGRAIELQEFDQAWEMYGPSAADKPSKSDFAKNFAGLDDITVALPAGTLEGAAGSSFYSVDVTITASDPDGRPIRYEGPVILRRVNDVPGASAEQLTWHISSVDLNWTH